MQKSTEYQQQNDPLGFLTTSHNSSSSKKNIFFMKTHKTGSTTLQNILMRYADRNNLHVGLSVNPSGPRFPGYARGEFFNRRYVRNDMNSSTINMILHHMRFSYTEVKAVMPQDTVYITILREPFNLFQSVFSYQHRNTKSFTHVPNDHQGLTTWLAHPERYAIIHNMNLSNCM